MTGWDREDRDKPEGGIPEGQEETLGAQEYGHYFDRGDGYALFNSTYTKIGMVVMFSQMYACIAIYQSVHLSICNLLYVSYTLINC